MTTQQHTPTPWYEINNVLFGPSGKAVDIGHVYRTTDAAFIVRACNAHDSLVAALEGVIRVADRKTDEFDAARAALKLARGES